MHPCKQDEGQTDHIRQRSIDSSETSGCTSQRSSAISAQASMVILTWILMHACETCVLGHLYSQRGDHSLWFQEQVTHIMQVHGGGTSELRWPSDVAMTLTGAL